MISTEVIKKYEVRECRVCTHLIANDLKYGRAANATDATLCSECLNCTHTFILPIPNGHESPGVCSKCGEARVHFNSAGERKGMHWKKMSEMGREWKERERKGMERK